MCAVEQKGGRGAGVREREREASTRRKERGPGGREGEQREEQIPRVLALLLDSMLDHYVMVALLFEAHIPNGRWEEMGHGLMPPVDEEGK